MTTERGCQSWLQRHSLSIFLLGLALGFSLLSGVAATNEWQVASVQVDDFADNRSAESFGAFLVTVATKWFREENSAQSKEPEEE